MNELDSLRQKLVEKRNELLALKEQNKTNKKKRIVKTASLVARIAIPAVLATGAVVGGIHFLGGGYPFVLDEIPTYERYAIESTYDGEITSIVDYSYDKKKIDPKLEIYTPYEKNGDGYTRKVKSFALDKVDEEELYNAINNKDINYFVKNLKEIDERTETKETLPEDNKDHMVASFTYLSKNYVCDVPETVSINTEITIIEIYASLFLSFIISTDYILFFGDKRKEIKQKYPIKSINSINNEIEEIESSIAIDEGEIHHAR